MALSYRDIKPDKHFAETIWNAEQSAPRWFREASAVWHPTFESYLDFWNQCGEIFGLFDGETLVACVYLEIIAGVQVNIHISVIGKVRTSELVRFFRSLKNQKAIEGYTIMCGWLLSKNRGLIRIAADAGFSATGLRMDYGKSNGRVLRWVQVRGE